MNTGREFGTLCIIAGCNNPRALMAAGKESRYCREHLNAIYERAAARRSESAADKRRKKHKAAKCEHVVIVDYADDCLLFVSGEVEETESLPDSDMEVQERLAKLANEGYRIARPHPFRQVDINRYNRKLHDNRGVEHE